MLATTIGRMTFMQTLHIATYNIHKGFSQFNRRVVLHALRERLRELMRTSCFCRRSKASIPSTVCGTAITPRSQHEFNRRRNLAAFRLRQRSVYTAGHHGNALLSRFR